jgi:hypothetical protein
MIPPPDLDRFRWPSSASPPTTPGGRSPRHRLGESFLKGPIPWAWIDRAGRLPGKALAVGLVLWFRAGIRKDRTVRLCQARVDSLGLGEGTTRRGIRELERAGLISVRRSPGRGLEVTLLDLAHAPVSSSARSAPQVGARIAASPTTSGRIGELPPDDVDSRGIVDTEHGMIARSRRRPRGRRAGF